MESRGNGFFSFPDISSKFRSLLQESFTIKGFGHSSKKFSRCEEEEKVDKN